MAQIQAIGVANKWRVVEEWVKVKASTSRKERESPHGWLEFFLREDTQLIANCFNGILSNSSYRTRVSNTMVKRKVWTKSNSPGEKTPPQ